MENKASGFSRSILSILAFSIGVGFGVAGTLLFNSDRFVVGTFATAWGKQTVETLYRTNLRTGETWIAGENTGPKWIAVSPQQLTETERAIAETQTKIREIENTGVLHGLQEKLTDLEELMTDLAELGRVIAEEKAQEKTENPPKSEQ